MSAQFFSSLADNALFVAAVELLGEAPEAALPPVPALPTGVEGAAGLSAQPPSATRPTKSETARSDTAWLFVKRWPEEDDDQA